MTQIGLLLVFTTAACTVIFFSKNVLGEQCCYSWELTYDHPQQKFCQADFVALAYVSGKDIVGSTAIYTVEIYEVFKGDVSSWTSTSSSYATFQTEVKAIAGYCDPHLDKDVYLISASGPPTDLSTSLCKWNRKWSDVTTTQLEGLHSLYQQYCEDCGILESPFTVPLEYILQNNLPLPKKCAYHPDSQCEKLYSHCKYSEYTGCQWTTNDQYQKCLAQL